MASDLWPPASYKMTLENSRPTACYFQWNSWKIWSNHFRAASLRSFLTSDLLLGDQNAWAAEKKYLCCIWASAHSVIKALSLFFVLIEFTFSSIWTVQPRSDCPASASGLGWTTIRPWLDSPDLGKWKFYRDKETSLSSFVTSEQSFKCSTEHLFYLNLKSTFSELSFEVYNMSFGQNFQNFYFFTIEFLLII